MITTNQAPGAAGSAAIAAAPHASGHRTSHATSEPRVPPATSAVIRQYLADGSYGATVRKGGAPTIRIDDGRGFGDVAGRKQNAGDRRQNNYSVTDANFYPTLGVLNDVSTGKPLNYVRQIQAYNAAGYVAAFHPDLYERMVRVQDAGQGTILGMSLNLMGVEGAQLDPGMSAAGLAPGQLSRELVPGTPLNARTVVMSGRDLSGEEWARPHHAESSWSVFRQLTAAGIDWKTAMVLSGDDAISGSGRLNGFNNQDGADGFNDDEAAVFRMAAVLQRATGVPILQIVAGGHSHTGIDESAKTKPNINKLLGLAHDDRSTSPGRMARLEQALLDGTIRSKGASKFGVDGSRAFAGFGGNSSLLAHAIGQVGDTRVRHRPTDAAVHRPDGEVRIGGGAGAAPIRMGCGCSQDPVAGAGLLGGGPELGSLATALRRLLEALAPVAPLLGTAAPSAASGPLVRLHQAA